MNGLKKFIEGKLFERFILVIILINTVVIGLQTSQDIMAACGNVLDIIDMVCLGIFILELILKLIVYRFRFFKDGWNIFDFIIVVLSVASTLSFIKVFRILRVFRLLRSLKALKSLRSLRLVSWLGKLRAIIKAIGNSLPGIFWSLLLMVIIYYVFSVIGVTMFGESFPDWFGTIWKSMYTLFQVMTLESWSMGISRPVMEVFSWAWAYFVPFVLISSFIMMNVIVGIVVNSISEVSALSAADYKKRKEGEQEEASELDDAEDESEFSLEAAEDKSSALAEAETTVAAVSYSEDVKELRKEVSLLREQIAGLETLLREQKQ